MHYMLVWDCFAALKLMSNFVKFSCTRCCTFFSWVKFVCGQITRVSLVLQVFFCVWSDWRLFVVVFLDAHMCKLILIQPLKFDTCLGIRLPQCSQPHTHTHPASQSSSIPRWYPITGLQRHTHTNTHILFVFFCHCSVTKPQAKTLTLPSHYCISETRPEQEIV